MHRSERIRMGLSSRFDVIGMAWEYVNILYILQIGIYIISNRHVDHHHQAQARAYLESPRQLEAKVRPGRAYGLAPVGRQWLCKWCCSRWNTSFLHLIFIFTIVTGKIAGTYLFLIRSARQLCIWHH